MDRIEFLVEEPSIAEVLKTILPQILPAHWVLNENYFIRPHNGKSDLKRSIPIKLKAFSQIRNQITGFVIIQDQDSNDCRELKQKLFDLCNHNKSQNIKFLIRIVCHELESWYLGDMDALSAVFPRFHPENYRNKAKFRNPDSIINPKYELKQIVGSYSQISMAKDISSHISIVNNKSESFHQLINGVMRFIET